MNELAKQLLKAISNYFSRDFFSPLCDVAADVAYQTRAFEAQLWEILAIENVMEEPALAGKLKIAPMF